MGDRNIRTMVVTVTILRGVCALYYNDNMCTYCRCMCGNNFGRPSTERPARPQSRVIRRVQLPRLRFEKPRVLRNIEFFDVPLRSGRDGVGVGRVGDPAVRKRRTESIGARPAVLYNGNV